ncbi:hypothetical protein H5410_000593 [Solanum commersonii]|uniref:Pentatricopeptide repeat-containing protein n=1 Tax=Solanum commersonii TaxID=4109 RepID=A0A9J6AWN4_SOLCO|nr:hypothetical protein H5410_000593 [Solanum commersonii]
MRCLWGKWEYGFGFLMFSRMPYRDVYSWTSMIHGYLRLLLSFFENMMVQEDVKCGLLKPNEATFVSIFSSCTFLDVGVALYLGRQVHAKMEHYGFMKKMPFEADATFLGDLMGACRLHGAIELGNEVA